jgi:acyl carrier protein
MDEMRSRIRSFIAKEVLLEENPSVVTDRTRLVGGVLDSLGLMQLVSYLQETFAVTFEESEVTPENFRTVADVEQLVRQKVPGEVG